ncbi:D-xylulose reductase A [Aspergillus flavus AF70]|nr:D-xylulose reductase A [Aspergillus flavus AF70]
MESNNPSWFLYGPGEARLQSLPIPEIQDPHDVIVRIAYVGVCGSDVRYRSQGSSNNTGTPRMSLLLTHYWLGHETAGTIHTVGTAVKSVQVGDPVAIEPGIPCRRCRACKHGTYNICREMKFAAVPPDVHGTLTKYYRVPEDFVYKIPSGMSLQEAVLMEPLSVAVHSTRLVNITPGQTIVIMGSGSVGLLCGAVAKAFGAHRIILADILEHKLSFGSEFLDCETFLVSLDETPEESAARLLDMLDAPDGVDAVIEASGAEGPVQIGIYALRRGGSYVQAGVGKPKAEIPILALSQKELHVHGCFRYGPGDYDLALKLITKGSIDVKRLITSVTPFEQAPQAWDKTARGEGIKNLIQGVQD